MSLTFVAILGLTAVTGAGAQQPLLPAVDVQEQIYTYEPADNGAGPLWCYGSTCLVRIGDDVFASGLETLKGQKPLNNCRWLLFKRTGQGWQLLQADPQGRTREPCPLGGFPDGRLFLSANPTLTEPGAYNGSAQPEVLQFSATSPAAPPVTMVPPWSEKAAFTEHSYRGFCADGPRRELLLFNILGYTEYHWSFMDREGKWSSQGKLMFPPGNEYEVPEPIRCCYPELALVDRSVHVLAVSDIIEPVKAWREEKLKLNAGRQWDYDFRRLFYTSTPDITKTAFAPWVEIASREKTAGHITNLDIWVDPQGRAHLLWLDESLWDLRMREKFFPGVPHTYSLNTCVVDKGQVIERATLASGGEGLSQEIPGYARFHATPDGRLFVFYYCSGVNAQGAGVSENRIMEVFPDGTHGEPVRVPLEHPFTSFMTATERGGSPPSNDLEVLGETVGLAGICYARIALLNKVLADFSFTVSRTGTGSRVKLDGAASRSAVGKIASWDWSIDGLPATGVQVERTVAHSGEARVSLTAKDDQGNARTATRTLRLPPAPTDFGLGGWGLVLRTEAESFVKEGGGTVQLRDDKLAASGRSFSHWNSKSHWLEWEIDVPREDDYFLLARYATPENAARALTLDGQPAGTMRFPSSGGYGSVSADDWAFAALTGGDGKPLALRLAVGAHTLRLQNPDGTGLNLDYLEWVAKTSPAPEAALSPAACVVDEDGYRYLLPLHGTLVPSQIRSDSGFGYYCTLGPRTPGDGLANVPASRLRLYEDGKELGPAHAVHVDIREKGLGRYSHWKTGLFLSASDNSDPTTNGRKYTWRIEP